MRAPVAWGAFCREAQAFPKQLPFCRRRAPVSPSPRWPARRPGGDRGGCTPCCESRGKTRRKKEI